MGAPAVRVTWSSASRPAETERPVRPNDIFPEASGLVLPEEEPSWQTPVGRRPQWCSDSLTGSGVQTNKVYSRTTAPSATVFTPRPKTPVRGSSRRLQSSPGSVTKHSRPGTTGSRPRAPRHSHITSLAESQEWMKHSPPPPGVPRLNLPARGAGLASASAPSPREATLMKKPSHLQISINRCVSNRTVSRINGIARYRSYRALSEQIAHDHPQEELVQPDKVNPGKLPEKLPHKPDETLSPASNALAKARIQAKHQVLKVRAPDISSCTLFFQRHRSYSSAGVPGKGQTPRPSVARLLRTVQSGYMKEFMLPREPRGFVFTREGPKDKQNSPRVYKHRLAATSEPGTGAPSQEVMGELDPPKRLTKIVPRYVNGLRFMVDILGGKHPTDYRNEVRAKAMAWIDGMERRYKEKCQRTFEDRVTALHKELEDKYGVGDPDIIIKEQLRPKLRAMAQQSIKRDQGLELEWLRVQEWNLTKVAAYFGEEYREELQEAEAWRMYERQGGDRAVRRRTFVRKQESKVSDRSTKVAAAFKDTMQVKTAIQKKLEDSQKGLSEEDAQAAEHLAHVAAMQAQKKQEQTAAKVGAWAAKATETVKQKAQQKQKQMVIDGEKAHQVYVAACHENGALECHYLRPMLSTNKVALNDDILFPNHIRALGACFKAVPHLNTLVLKACGLDDNALDVLFEEIYDLELEELGLPQNYFSAKACAELALMLAPVSFPGRQPSRPASCLSETLTVLNLQDNPVGDQGLYAIADVLTHHPGLHTLNLSRTNLTDTAAPGLERLLSRSTTLESLNVSWNKLSVHSGEALGAALFQTKTLTNLHLGWNSLQDEGTTAIAEALRYHKNCPLLVLNLSAARMQSQGYLALAAMVKHNPTLRLRRLVFNFSLMENVGAQCLMRAVKNTRQRLKLDVQNCTLKYGNPPDILKGALEYTKEDLQLLEVERDGAEPQTSKFELDLTSSKDRGLVKFLLEHELEAYSMGRISWYTVSLDRRLLRKAGRAVNSVDPFDVVRMGWLEHLPHVGSLRLEVLSLPPEHVMEGLELREHNWEDDGEGSGPNSPPLSP